MTRHLIVFVVTFAIGAVIAVVLRTGSHKPYEEHRGHPAPGAASAAPATAYDAADPHAGHAAPATTPPPATAESHQGHTTPMVSAPTTDAHVGHERNGAIAASAAPASPVTPASEHAGHGQHTNQTPAVPIAPTTGAVNSICAICGMPVNPALGTIEYKGKQIGFGCKACPPKFKADPAKYGEAALKNQVVE